MTGTINPKAIDALISRERMHGAVQAVVDACMSSLPGSINDRYDMWQLVRMFIVADALTGIEVEL